MNMNKLCRRSANITLELPFLMLIILGHSIGSLAPHHALMVLDEDSPLDSSRRLARCYRLLRGKYFDDLHALEEAALSVGGKRLGNLMRSYTISYGVRANKAAIVGELVEKAVELFKEELSSKLSTVNETIKLSLLMLSMNIMIISFAALVASNTGAILGASILAVIIALATPFFARVNKITLLAVKNSNTVTILNAAYIASLATTLALRPPLLYLPLAVAVAADVASNIVLIKSFRSVEETRLAARSLSDSFATGAREIRVRGKALALTVRAGERMASRIGVEGSPLEKLTSKTIASLVSAGGEAVKKLKLVESIIESLEEAYRRILSTHLAASTMLVMILIVSAISLKVVSTLFVSPASVGGGPLPVLGGGNMKTVAPLYLAATSVAVIVMGISYSYTLTGLLATNPAPILALLVAKKILLAP